MKKRASIWLVALIAAALVLSFACDGGKKVEAKPPANPEVGMQIFGEQCASCHNSDSVEMLEGPGLKGYFARDDMFNGSQLLLSSIRASIDFGSYKMPAFKSKLTDSQKDDLMAYMKTL